MKTALILVHLSLLLLLVPWWFVLCDTAIAIERINTTVTNEYFLGERELAYDRQGASLQQTPKFYEISLAVRNKMSNEKAKLKLTKIKGVMNLIKILEDIYYGFFWA